MVIQYGILPVNIRPKSFKILGDILITHQRLFIGYSASNMALTKTKQRYDHKPEEIIKKENAKFLWDFMIQCRHDIDNKKPDIFLTEKDSK